MDYERMKVKVIRKDKEINLHFEGVSIADILLTEPSNDDLKTFFDQLFDYIILNEKLVTFELDDDGHQDLFHDVSVDIIQHLNSEIKQSENNFTEIISLKTQA